ncbi:MAG: hypothetical protein V4662_24405 [Verrucomicrobiota bacterium]
MTTTLTVDAEGRLPLPKKILAQMHLQAGSKLRASFTDSKLELFPSENEVKIERRGKRRVVTGWQGFDAAKAVREMREDQTQRLGRRRSA